MRPRAHPSRCEQGPIRPPSEAASLLIRITRNCPWNNCLFCPVYKETRFARRGEEEVMDEIDRLAEAAGNVRRRLGIDASVTAISAQDCMAIVRDNRATYEERRIALWMHRGERNAFLQDADSLILPHHRIARSLRHLRDRFPEIDRVTTYARSRTLVAKTEAQLTALKEAGLSRIHAGLESGSDEVLSLVQKGCRAEHHITGISRAKGAGLEVCCYVMPGLGGRALSAVHAEETARVLRAIDPTHVRLRTMFLTEGIPLYKKVESKEMTLMEEDEVIEEIRALTRGLVGVNGEVVSDHDHNLLTDIEGHLTEDAAAIDAKLTRFIALPKDTRDSFVAARRSGHLRSLESFLADPAHATRYLSLVSELRDLGEGSLLAGMSKRFSPRLF